MINKQDFKNINSLKTNVKILAIGGYMDVGNKCKSDRRQTDTILIDNNERKDLAF